MINMITNVMTCLERQNVQDKYIPVCLSERQLPAAHRTLADESVMKL